MTIEDDVKKKVFEFTKEIFSWAELDPDGDVTFEFQSTKVWIDVVKMSRPDGIKIKEFVVEHELPMTLVRIRAVLVADVPRSPALFQYVATDARRNLGSINVVLDDEGTCDLFFMYSLAGDDITAGELKHAAFIVATVANQLDDEIQQKFGGKRWAEIKA
jgi:hypothetical protein